MAPVGRGLVRFGIFNLVGLAGFVWQIAALSALTRLAGWPSVLATIVALEIAVLHNFAGHLRWTWADRPPGSRRTLWARLAAFQTAQLVTIAANLALTEGIARAAGMPIELANLIAVVALSGVNFLAAATLVFRDASPAESRYPEIV